MGKIIEEIKKRAFNLVTGVLLIVLALVKISSIELMSFIFLIVIGVFLAIPAVGHILKTIITAKQMS